MSGLTFKQRKLRDFVRSYIADMGYSPSFDDIALGMGYKSKSAVARTIARLVERGELTKIPDKARSLALPAAISLSLPPDLEVRVHDIAKRTNVTPEAVIIECVRDAMSPKRSNFVSRETVTARL